MESLETVHPGYDILAELPDARRRGVITRRRGVSARRSWRRGAEAGDRTKSRKPGNEAEGLDSTEPSELDGGVQA